ncbi:MAG: hypothetical protein FJX75_20415 [Armatimonadetes bacterium]|nr:hypothetical protein [Armatimonadota bacterium]
MQRLVWLGLLLVVLSVAGGCGGAGGLWGIDPELVAAWRQTDLTEDGVPAYFVGKTMQFRDDGTWRSDSDDGGWSLGGYQTRSGRLNYWIDASDDPGNVGGNYTFDYAVMSARMTISGHMSGHYYVAYFARL